MIYFFQDFFCCVFFKEHIIAGLTPDFDFFRFNGKALCHNRNQRFGAGQDPGIILCKYFPEINSGHFTKVGIHQCYFFQGNPMPQIHDHSVPVQVGTIYRQSGRSKPDSCFQHFLDPLSGVCLYKIFLPILF